MLSLLRKDVRGATTLEYAIAFPLYLVFLLCTLELLRISYNSLSLQYICTEVARELSINAPTNSAEVKNAVETRLSAFGIDLNYSTDSVTFCPVRIYGASACPNGSFVAGKRLSPMAFSVKKEIQEFILPKVLLPVYRLEGFIIIRNEPW